MRYPFVIDCRGHEFYVGHSELALHCGVAGRRLMRVHYSSPRYCYVRVAGHRSLVEGLVDELLPHELRFPVRSRTVRG